ncbi:DNA repair protein RecN [Halotalea alkalilenta]|uniref:DNA repair protein RecN n=1 Tax=Halotalea alkalilenta TaxID=376489 RepID=A0A172YA30_9GAMM|nr:DNA repair protein RecN [Halotalea alkalilenta]ANF56089.1 DNA repair protein RecN [Halotalea alkalilenta]
MLTQLTIRDYAIVDRLELDFHRGMTAITGETGAGKSILLDALSLCLGERADAGSVRHGTERAELSARFDISRLPEAKEWLEARELGSDDCLLRRVISSGGRTKAWINGSPCTIADLKALGERLIDIHAQHAHQSLLREQQHQRLLDEYAGITAEVDELRGMHRDWSLLRKRLRQAQESGDEIQARRQLLRYQVEELDTLGLAEGELERLEEEQTSLAHAEQSLSEAQLALRYCEDDEEGALARLLRARSGLAELPGSDRGALAAALSLLEEASIQIEEAGRELNRFVDATELDPTRLAEVDSRLGDVHRIARKHHVMPDEVVELHRRLADELAQLEVGDDDLEALALKTRQLRDEWRTLAQRISDIRQRKACELGEQIQAQLAFLGMEKARFEVAVSPRESAQPEGIDQVQFRISANPGQPPRALNKIASGGELSRISLAIQVVAARHSTIPTLVFDEVDVGISGATAEIVGQLLRGLGERDAQILCVTHLPQVAAQGHQHLHIEKQATDESTLTQMALLDESGRIRELARMLGGVHLSERTLAHAHEMLSAGQHAAQH